MATGFATVLHTIHPDAGNNGQYFYFDPTAWMNAVNASSVGGTHNIYQYRGSQLVWSGTVVVWNSTNGMHGRRNQGTGANQFQVGDVLATWEPNTVYQDIGAAAFDQLFALSNTGIVKQWPQTGASW